MHEYHLYIVCYKRFEKPTMDAFKTEKDTLDFIKAAKEEIVFENIFSMDCYGETKRYELKFNGQFYLEEKEGENNA